MKKESKTLNHIDECFESFWKMNGNETIISFIIFPKFTCRSTSLCIPLKTFPGLKSRGGRVEHLQEWLDLREAWSNKSQKYLQGSVSVITHFPDL